MEVNAMSTAGNWQHSPCLQGVVLPPYRVHNDGDTHPSAAPATLWSPNIAGWNINQLLMAFRVSL